MSNVLLRDTPSWMKEKPRHRTSPSTQLYCTRPPADLSDLPGESHAVQPHRYRYQTKSPYPCLGRYLASTPKQSNSKSTCPLHVTRANTINSQTKRSSICHCTDERAFFKVFLRFFRHGSAPSSTDPSDRPRKCLSGALEFSIELLSFSFRARCRWIAETSMF